jgi:DNA-binding NarL/FixJ family response regulator
MHLADRIREVATPAPPDAVGQAGNRARVAVICQGDDERTSLCSLLHDADCTVDAWSDPASAASHHPPAPTPDVLVLSLQFGEGTDAGLQAIETARRHWPGVPVLVTTAHRDLATRLAALSAGAAGVMVKPFAAEELLQRIGHLRVGDPPPDPVVVVEPGGNQPDADASEARTWPAHWQVVHSIAALSAASQSTLGPLPPQGAQMFRPSLSCLAVLMTAMTQSALGQSSTIVYKCPGNVYTSERELTAKQADEKGCKVIEGTPITCSSPTASSCFPDRSDMRDRHPRSAIGLTAGCRTTA